MIFFYMYIFNSYYKINLSFMPNIIIITYNNTIITFIVASSSTLLKTYISRGLTIIRIC